MGYEIKFIFNPSWGRCINVNNPIDDICLLRENQFLIQISWEEVKTFGTFKFSLLRVIMVKSGKRIRKRVATYCITTVYVRDYAVNATHRIIIIQFNIHKQTKCMRP